MRLFTKLSLFFTFICAAIYSYHFYISSSEFWSISSVNTYPITDTQFLSKFLFNSILKGLFVFDLTDLQHIQFAKIIFSALGAGVVCFILRTFNQSLEQKPKMEKIGLYALLALFLASPQFLTNFFRIRTDTLALGLFLFEYLLFKKQKRTLFFVFLYPLIGIKHVMYSILCLCLNIEPIQKFILKLKAQSLLKKINLLLFLLILTIGFLNLYINEVFYWMRNYSESSGSSLFLFRWFQQEWPLLLICLLLLASNIRFKKVNFPIFLVYLFLITFTISSPFQQPYYLNLFIFPFYFITLYEFADGYVFKKIHLYPGFILLAFVLGNYFWKTNHYHWYSSSDEQFQAVDSLSTFVTTNRLSYIDGMGILPRTKQSTCFISPADEISNENCRQRIKNHEVDVIIFTQRLLSEASQAIEGLDSTYSEIYMGVASKKKCTELKCNEGLTHVKPFKNFAFEFN